jgi:hypothetical protein
MPDSVDVVFVETDLEGVVATKELHTFKGAIKARRVGERRVGATRKRSFARRSDSARSLSLALVRVVHRPETPQLLRGIMAPRGTRTNSRSSKSENRSRIRTPRLAPYLHPSASRPEPFRSTCDTTLSDTSHH